MHILAPQHLVSDTYAMARFLKLHRENHHFSLNWAGDSRAKRHRAGYRQYTVKEEPSLGGENTFLAVLYFCNQTLM